MEFEPGQIVMLKSGGPAMTVVSVGDNGVECVWIGDSGALFQETLPAVALDLIDMSMDDLDADDDEDGEAEDDDDDDD